MKKERKESRPLKSHLPGRKKKMRRKEKEEKMMSIGYDQEGRECRAGKDSVISPESLTGEQAVCLAKSLVSGAGDKRRFAGALIGNDYVPYIICGKDGMLKRIGLRPTAKYAQRQAEKMKKEEAERYLKGIWNIIENEEKGIRFWRQEYGASGDE